MGNDFLVMNRTSTATSISKRSMLVHGEHLIELFYADSQHFDIEGKLLVQRDQRKQQTKSTWSSSSSSSSSSVIRRYQVCLCRLRGNILLVADICSSTKLIDLRTLNVIILKNFDINLCEESNQFEFCIRLNPKNSHFTERYYFNFTSRNERDQWIQCIYLVSSPFLRSFKQALYEDLVRKQEANIEWNESLENVNTISTLNLEKDIFILVKCDNLRLGGCIEPLVYINVYCRRKYIDQLWQSLGKTELIESRSPQFKCGISLPAYPHSLIELKFELRTVIERRFDTSHLIAFAYFHLNGHFNHSSNCKFNHHRLKVISVGSNKVVGLLSFQVHKRSNDIKKSLSLDNLTCLNKSIISLAKSTSNLVMDRTADPNGSNKKTNKIFDNTISKRFVFKPFIHCQDLIIEESMSESKYAFLIPQTLLNLYAQDEEKIIAMIMQSIRDNFLLARNFFDPFLQLHWKLLQTFKDSWSQIENFKLTRSFRPSTFKKDQFLQFVPVNFHKQVCHAFDDKRSSSIEFFTCGAYTCHHLGFEQSGMKSLTTSKKECHQVTECWRFMKHLFTILHCESYIMENINKIAQIECKEFELKKVEPIYKSICILSTKLIDIISNFEVEELLSYLNATSGGKFNIFDDEFQLEPIELVYLNIKACVVAINFKLSQNPISKEDLDSCNRKLKGAIDSLRKISFACYLGSISQLTKEQIDSLYKLRFRHLSISSQTLTSNIIFIMNQVDRKNFIRDVHRTGNIIIQHEVLLSCISDEMGMLEDMSYSLEELSNYVTVLFTIDSEQDGSSVSPIIETFGDQIRLKFRLNPKEMDFVTTEFECKIISLMFNIGVNEQASIAEKFGMNTFQNELNSASFQKLKQFIMKYHGNDDRMNILLNQLKHEMSLSISKNIKVLQLVRKIVRHIGGICVTCCKSAKDRTGMSVTLEEVRFFFHLFKLDKGVNESLFQEMLDTLRRDGVRIENVLKNIGARKYAFNRLQLLTYPKLFRPPTGTYATLET